MQVNLVFDFYADIIDVPNEIGESLLDYQEQFDEWIFNNKKHPFWKSDGRKRNDYVLVTSEAFIFWLNNFVIKNSYKATIVKRQSKEYDSSLPTIFF